MYQNFLKDKQNIYSLEYDTKTELLSTQELKNFNKRLNHKKLKMNVRHASIDLQVKELKELREFEL